MTCCGVRPDGAACQEAFAAFVRSVYLDSERQEISKSSATAPMELASQQSVNERQRERWEEDARVRARART